MSPQELLFQADGIYKNFGITKALNGVKLDLCKGQVLGLIGENGSGKSTLATIIVAIQKADSGKMFKEGKPYNPNSVVEANNEGVFMLLQEKATFDELTVAQNIFIGKEDIFLEHGLLDQKKMNMEARKALNKINCFDIKSEIVLGKLDFEEKKLVELARAVYWDPWILIVDEATTALSRKGRDILYEIINKMRWEGKGVIFISHDIEELMEKCDELMILRDGNYVDKIQKKNFDEALIRKLMVGREIADHYYREDYESAKPTESVMKFENVMAGALSNISFELHKGEILGFGGLAACGMHDIGRASFGLLRPEAGTITDHSGAVIDNPIKAMSLGAAYISKNRDQESLMVASSIKDNICLPSYPKLSKGCLIFPKSENKFVREWSDRLNVKMQNSNQFVMDLSGGNKQKVALAKWLGFGADIFILDCPTRGIDIGVKTNIYRLMTELREQGESIILISEELPELIGMSDRVIILRHGKISGEFMREEMLTEEKLIDYMV